MARIYPVPFEGEAPPEFGIDASRVGVITLDLSVARTRVRVDIGGTFLWAAGGSDNAASIDVALSERNQFDGIPFKPGTSLGGIRFSEIYVTNAAQAGKTITLIYTVEDVRNGVRIDNPTGDFSSVTVTSPTTGADAADASLAVGAQANIAANTSRRRLTVYAPPTNTEYLRVGFAVADTRGFPLAAGAWIDIETTAQVQVRNPSTNLAAQSYGYLEQSA